jgi:hypothetical protein
LFCLTLQKPSTIFFREFTVRGQVGSVGASIVESIASLRVRKDQRFLRIRFVKAKETNRGSSEEIAGARLLVRLASNALNNSIGV